MQIEISLLLFSETLFEAFYPAGGIYKLLLTGKKGMAFRTNPNTDARACGSSVNDIPTGTSDGRICVFRMDTSFHTE